MPDVKELMSQIKEGMDVYSSDGEKVGEVGDVLFGSEPQGPAGEVSEEERDYFRVKRGFLGLGESDFWLGGTSVASVEDNKVNLRYSKDETPTHGYNEPPESPDSGSAGGTTNANPNAAASPIIAPGGTGATGDYTP